MSAPAGCLACGEVSRPGARFCTACGEIVPVAATDAGTGTRTGTYSNSGHPTDPALRPPGPRALGTAETYVPHDGYGLPDDHGLRYDGHRFPDSDRLRYGPGARSNHAAVREPFLRRSLLPILVVALVLAAGGATAAFLAYRSGLQQADAAATGTPETGQAEGAGPSVPAPSTDPLPTPAPEQAGSGSAETELTGTADADRATADGLIGYWLPEVSAKMPGRDGYDAAAVLADHRTQAAARPGTSFLLVRSGDYSTFQLDGYWITLAATPFGTAGEANSWCDANGYGRDDCFAKFLSHSDGPAGNTVHRR